LNDVTHRAMTEWKLVAMVIDRLCFVLFTVFFGVATLVVFRRQLWPSSRCTVH